MLSKTMTERILSEALRSGGDFAEIFMQDKRSSSISTLSGCIENAAVTRLHGAGIRIFKGLTAIYVHTNDTTPEGLLAAARQAADAIGTAGTAADVHLVGSILPNIHPVRVLPLDVDGKRRADLVLRADAAARAVSSEITQVAASISASESDILIANSEGLFTQDKRVYTRFAVSAIASDGHENQTGSSSPGAMLGFELFDTSVDVEKEAVRAANRAVTMLHAKPCPAGTMPVVIDGGFGGVIFHEACGHSLEATAVAYGNSEFCGKLGQKIASDKVTAIDDGTIPNAWGSTNTDDEGTPTTRLTLIENGILKNYMVDKLNARRMQMPVTGSARRQDFTYAPTSRMRNTFIAPGEDDESEIIASCGDGLYAKAMGGGSVNPVTGQFNFAVSEGYLIRDGKIAEPVRGATLIGRGAEILPRIDRVGRRMWMAQGMCGSVSGSVPTNVGQPMIRVSEITVGGR